MWRSPRSTVGVASVSPWTYLLNQIQMIVSYAGLAVWPRSLVVDYGLPRALTIGDVVPQALLLLLMLGGTVVALVRWQAIGFLGAMFFLTLAPTSSVVPIASEVGSERRMYLPLAALVVLEQPEVRRAATVAAYVSIGVEPGTGPLLESLTVLGKRVILPVVLRYLPPKLGIPIHSATVEHLQFIIIGALIILFLIAEPHGLARLWQIGKQKLRVWPFPY